MRILFVTSTCPEDIRTCTSGIFQRMKMFMKAINKLADIDVLFYVNANTDVSPGNATRMEQLLEKYWSCKTRVFLCQKSQQYTVNVPTQFPFSDKIKEWWFLHPLLYAAARHEQVVAFDECLEKKPDAVFVHRLNSVRPVLASRKAVPPVFFDLDDIEHKAFTRILKQPPFWRSKFLQYLKVPSLLWLERCALNLAERTFVCSECDRNYLKKMFPLRHVISIPNAIEIPPLLKRAQAPVFLFIGQYIYAPNAVAADYLISKVWPIIKLEIPEAKLIIAGKNPEKIAGFQGKHEGVEFRGFVDNLDDLYRETRIVCCPILSGSGTRVKIIEAAAYGKGIVSTAVGAEGLDFVDGLEIIIKDDYAQFAQACIALVKDRSLCDEMGRAAREKAIKLYSRDNVTKMILDEFQALRNRERPDFHVTEIVSSF